MPCQCPPRLSCKLDPPPLSLSSPGGFDCRHKLWPWLQAAPRVDRHQRTDRFGAVLLSRSAAHTIFCALHPPRYEDALDLASRCLQIAETMYGPDDLRLAVPYILVGRATAGLGRLKKAEKILSLANYVVLKVRTHPPTYPIRTPARTIRTHATRTRTRTPHAMFATVACVIVVRSCCHSNP